MPRTHIERMWIIGVGLLGLALTVVSYFFFIGPQRSQTSTVDTQVSSARASNNVLEARIAHLALEYKDLTSYQTILAHARLALPATSGIPDFLRTLQSIGNATGSDVSSLTVGNPVGITSPAAAATPTAAPSSNSAAAALAAPSAAAGAVSTLTTPAGSVYALPITAQVTGSTKALDAFLTQLQKVQPRAVLISQITETKGSLPGAAGAASSTGSTSMQLTMEAFVAPTDAGESASVSQAAGK
jgi:Tfp pilus assembly protein PilO